MLEYESDTVERRLRSIIQKQQDVAYIFLGSRKHLIQKMFLDRSRPLYRAAGHYPLGPIETRHWIPFIDGKFRDGERPITEGAIQMVCNLTQGHPFYTQHVCHAMWELCEPGEQVAESLIQAAVQLLLDRESYAYTALWDSLLLNQKKLLKGFASEPPGVKPFAGVFCAEPWLGICFEFTAGCGEFAEARSY